MPVEKIKVTIARELCQLNGIEIYPEDRGWSTKIIVKIGKKEKVSKENYIAPTVKVNGKWQIGYEEKINDLWLHYAAKIKKKLTVHNLGDSGSSTGGAVAAGLPLLISPKDEFLACLILFAIVVGLTGLVIAIALAIAAYRKNRN